MASPEPVIQAGHVHGITAVALQLDGALAASADLDGLVVLWDLRSRKILRRLPASSVPAVGVAFSPHGDCLATLFQDGTVRLWDVGSGALLRTWTSAPLEDAMQSGLPLLAFGPGGLLSVQAADTVEVRDPATGAAVVTFEGRGAPWAGPSRVATVDRSQREVRLVDVPSGREIRRFRGADGRMLAVSRDGTLLAATDGARLTTWRAATGDVVRTESIEDARALAFAPGGIALAVSDNRGISFLQLPGGDVRRAAESMGADLLEYLPDGRGMLAARFDALCVVTPDDGTTLGCMRSRLRPVEGVSFSSDGRTLFAGSSELRAWDLASASFVRRFNAFGPVAAGNADALVATVFPGESGMKGDGDVHVFDAATGGELRRITPRGRHVHAIAVAPHEPLVVAASAIGTEEEATAVEAWDARDGSARWGRVIAGRVTGMSFAPSGARLAIAYVTPGAAQAHASDRIDVLDVATREVVASLSGGPAASSDETPSLSFDREGRLLAGGTSTDDLGAAAVIWDTRSWMRVHELRGFRRFAFDGRELVGTGPTGELRRHDLATGATAVLASPVPHGVPAFSADGRLVAAGSVDGRVRLWRRSDGAPLVDLVAADDEAAREAAGEIPFASDSRQPPLESLAVSPDGTYMGTADAHRLIAFRVGTRAHSFEQFDVQFNRPDVLLERIGLTSESRLAAWRRARERRSARLGAAAPRCRSGAAAVASTVLGPTPLIVRSDSIELRVMVRTRRPRSTLLRLTVNGVPVGNAWGVAIDTRRRRNGAFEQTVRLGLAQGDNYVSVAAADECASASVPDVAHVYRAGPVTLPRLFMVAVGVSAYDDPAHRLEWAAADAVEVARVLSSDIRWGGDVHTLVLVDRDATRGAILGSRALLAEARADDVVIFFLAGHGILDEHGDYRFAPVDHEFAAPSRRGLRFDELEAVLETGAAQRKLLLVDTCHSGEVEQRARPRTASGAHARGVALAAVRASPDALTSEIQLSEVFADLRRSTGSAVIAAARGAEYAHESSTVRHGYFTSALLEAIGEHGVVAEPLTVSRLRREVSRRVVELSRGAQHPVARRENLEYDFPLFR